MEGRVSPAAEDDDDDGGSEAVTGGGAVRFGALFLAAAGASWVRFRDGVGAVGGLVVVLVRLLVVPCVPSGSAALDECWAAAVDRVVRVLTVEAEGAAAAVDDRVGR